MAQPFSVQPLRWWQPALLLVAVAVAYGGALRAPFLFDDAAAITRNPTIRTLGSWDVLRPPADGSTTTGRPLVNLSFALDHALGGENPAIYRTTNLVLHGLSALALLGILRRTQPTARLAGIAAAIWAVHPLQSETVVNVAQRTEGLCGLLLLTCLYAFVRGAAADGASASKQARRCWLGASVAACLAGMAAKEVMVAAPLLVLLYDRTFVAGTFATAWRARRGYYAALFGTWLLLAALVLVGQGSRGVAAGFGLGVSTWDYLLTQAEALVLYLRLALWPYPLVLDYGTTVVRSLGAVWWQGLLVLALLGATGWALVRRPALGFAGAWFFLILAPSSSFVPLVTQTIAEHRMYLPLAAVIVLLVAAVARIPAPRGRVWGVAVVLTLAAVSVARSQDYRDAVRIWELTVRQRPENARAHNNLGWSLQASGRLADAERHYARAVELAPQYVPARYNRGVALLARGDASGAIAELKEAVRLAPAHADAHVNLGTALAAAGQPAAAVLHFQTAWQLQPAADIRFNLGLARLALGETTQAEAEFAAAVALDPGLTGAHLQLARIAERAGRISEAETRYRAVLQRTPGDAVALARLGLLCARADRLDEAAAHFRAALQVQPSDADLHANLGNVLLLQGQPRAAAESYEQAVRLRPQDRRFQEALAAARASLP